MALLPISAITAFEGIPGRSTDVCDGCHGGMYDLILEDPTISHPPDIDVDETDQVTVTALITADGTNSYWEFDARVRVISVNSGVMVTSARTFSNQRPSVGTSPNTWTREVTFDITGKVPGHDTLRAEVAMYPDHQSPQATRSVTGSITINNQAPTLSSGGVDPGSGDTKTDFTFRVVYSDPDGTVPSSVDLVIDGTRHAMTPEDGYADTIIDGEVYSESIRLDEMSHSFHFEASDGMNSTVFPATGNIQGPNVTRSNTAPVMSDPSVHPGSGNCNDTFQFEVTYTDAEGDPPVDGVTLILDGTRISPAMTTLEEGPLILRDGNHSNGERFSITLPLTCGTYEHSFNASDGVFHVEIGPFSGPVITESPVLIAQIDEPGHLMEFLSNVSIALKGSFSSNKNVTDADFRWRSNISGFLGRGPDLIVDLPVGTHGISLNVSSFEWSVFSLREITVMVKEPPEEVPVYVSGFSPDGAVEMLETESTRFNVTLNMEYVGSLDRVRWTLNEEETLSGSDEFTFSPGIDEEGDYLVAFQVLDPDGMNILHSVAWPVSVSEFIADIDITSSIREDLGEFYKRDLIEITLPVEDPFGRELSYSWMVDGSMVEEQGITFNLELRGEPWAQEGVHEIHAEVINPDGLSIRFNFTYELLPDPVIDDEDEDEQEDEDDEDEEEDRKRGIFSSVKGDRVAIAILIISSILILIGMVKSIYSLVKPANASPSMDREYDFMEE